MKKKTIKFSKEVKKDISNQIYKIAEDIFWRNFNSLEYTYDEEIEWTDLIYDEILKLIKKQ